ncbi:MAG: tetratricopeptide repeat protein [Melioribacteraceae bacterium]|nr:tetratricopeptide repeat protein [Melioribacteraceae bacterium]
MKLKPVYIYLSVFVLVIVAIVIFSTNDEQNNPQPNVTQQQTMPQDEIHKNLGSSPGNVSAEFRQKMERLKDNYESNPDDTVNAIEYARLLAAAHKPNDALNIYQEILKKDNSRDDLRIELATVYYNMQQYLEAKSELEYVLERNPNADDVIYNLGAVEASLGNTEKAKEIWKRLVNDFPNSDAAEFAKQSLENLD